MTKQIEQGKAFEYACLLAIQKRLSPPQNIEIIENTSLDVASNFYNNLSDELRQKLDRAAVTGANIIIRLEPQLLHPNGNEPLQLLLQADKKGEDGDVRDVICIRQQNNWEIGISCKHNHKAVKHSRLSRNLDFGAKWFNKRCSQSYFDEIAPIFDLLDELKKQNKLWKDIENKAEMVYKPLMNAFMKELTRLDESNPNCIASAFIQYLVGKNDFYKLIASKNLTEVQAYNLNGTLNRTSGKNRPEAKVHPLSLPERFIDIAYKKNSDSTLKITCDESWVISLRIHSAKTAVESSLKLDIQLEGVPANFYRQVEPWV